MEKTIKKEKIAQLAAARTRYLSLSVPPRPLPNGWAQKRGFEFERIVNEALDAVDLDPVSSFRPKGEQIDGSFVFSSRTFLLELKWQREPVPASALYSFKGKVDGKLIGTIGVYVAIGDYAEDAINALVAGKTLNLILFDRSDWEYSLDPNHGFSTVLAYKLRAAADLGTPYVPYRPATPQTPVAIVTEGLLDSALITEILAKLDPQLSKVPVYSAGGASNVANVVQLLQSRALYSRIVVIIDDDLAGTQTVRDLAEADEAASRVRVIVAEPYLDYALLPEIDERFGGYANFRTLPYRVRANYLTERVNEVPSDRLRHDRVISAILNALR